MLIILDFFLFDYHTCFNIVLNDRCPLYYYVSLEFSTLQLFFDLYFALPSTLSPHAIACLVQLASVRYGNT